jgi:hypothetical protein
MRIWSGLVWVALVSALGAAAAVACGNDAVGVQACRQIETARCEVAPSCPTQFPTFATVPVPDGDPVTACVRYYNDACLHGIVTTVAPSQLSVNQCVAEIQAIGKIAATARDAGAACTLLLDPWATPACDFVTADAGVVIVPDAASEDAGEDAAD